MIDFCYLMIVLPVLLPTLCFGDVPVALSQFSDATSPEAEIEQGFDFWNPPPHNESFVSDEILDGLKVRFENSSKLATVREFIQRMKGFKVHNKGVTLSGPDISRKPDWTFNAYHLHILVKIEIEIYKIFSAVHSDETLQDKQPVALISYIRDYETSTLIALNMISAEYNATGRLDRIPENDPYLYVATHPILVYRMIRRLSQDLPPLIYELQNVDNRVLPVLWRHANPRQLVLPTTEDLYNALVGIVRTQESHCLDTQKVAKGILGAVSTQINMTAFDSIELGTFYLVYEMFDLAVQWFHVAIVEAERSYGISRGPMDFFRFLLQFAIEKHNVYLQTKTNDPRKYFVFTKQIEGPYIPEKYTRWTTELVTNAQVETNRTEMLDKFEMKTKFQRLCSGERFLNTAEISRLHCWYERSSHKFWRINPLKMELLHENPRIVQIYEVLGERLMHRIKKDSVSSLERSTVVNYEEGLGSATVSTRTSSHAWLDEGEQEFQYLELLTKLYELLTGLKIASAGASDAYQVAFYGSSHHFDPHLDAFKRFDNNVAQAVRMTTILGFISEVEVGGRTAFPVLGTYAEPVKGSIIVWNNLKRNGRRDERMYHGGCPIVLGVKWIMQKWVHYGPNRPVNCLLIPDE